MNAITPVKPAAPTYQDAMFLAENFHKSGLFSKSVHSTEAAFAIILAGQELGVSPFQSLMTINIIDGKPAASAQLLLAKVRASGLLEHFRYEGDHTKATVWITRKGEAQHLHTFTIQEAHGLNLTGKYNWKQQPKVMLMWRCITAALRLVFTDIILGFYDPEELGAEVTVSDDGAMTVMAPPAQLPPPITSEDASIDAAFAETEAEGNDASDAPAALAGPQWNGTDVKTFLEFWEARSVSKGDLKAALELEGSWGEWMGSRAEADAAVNAYIDTQLARATAG